MEIMSIKGGRGERGGRWVGVQRLMEEPIKNVHIFITPLLQLQGHFEISQVFGTKM